ncbi:MAG: NAD(P)-dependent oxidoreductase [Nitrospinota bacterium]|nr:MAG: NAD(P)-dependent oxidoreductase [Nitrospinota bacterium]
MKIGWIGLGNMGKPMAKHVQEAGYEFAVHDLRRNVAADMLEAGAHWAESPAEVAEGKDIVFTCLPMPEDVASVALGPRGILEGLPPHGIFIDMSTNSLSMIKHLHAAFADKGRRMLDAPVSGGVQGAISRDLVVMASGDAETYQQVKPVLDAIGDKVIYCGPIGNGTICKLCHNLMTAGIYQVLAEILTMGVKAGVDVATLADAMSKGATGKQPPLARWWDTTFKGKFEGTPMSFYLELMRKDVRLACELGREVNVPMEIANIVEQRFITAMNRGWGRMNSNAAILLQEERAGVKLRIRE